MSNGRTFDAAVSEAIIANAPDDDVAGSFEDWRSALKDTEAPGKIQAYRIPLDEHGRASHSASGQIRLGSWPVDQYDFDTLCQIIMKEYMLPNERIMAVRLIGTLGGQGGVRFNKIVQLQRSNQTAVVPAEAKGGMADIMRAMNESNERMMKLIAEMSAAPRTSGGGQDEMMRTVAMMSTLMKPIQDLMGPMMTALVGRPVSAAPAGSMKETIETMMLIERFLGRRGGDGGAKRSDFAEIATAVSSVAKPLLELANTNAQANLRQHKKPAALPAPNPTVQPTAQPAVAQPPQQPPQPVVLPMDTPSQVQTPDLRGVDTSQPTINAPAQPAGDEVMFAEVKKQVDALVQVAAGGSDAKGVADLFYDQTMAPLPDDAYGQLCALIEDTAFLSKIAIFNAQVQTHAEWFKQFQAQVSKRIIDADSEEIPQ